MLVAVPREIKNTENRVAMTPAGVHELVAHGHDVVIEHDAGVGSHIGDDEYVAAGARIAPDADTTWADADLVVKVKEPIEDEYHRLREGQTLFTYLHLAADRPLTDTLLERRVTAIAYETVQAPDRTLPLLAPMSEIAGRLAPQVGAATLMKGAGGRGVLLGGVPGVAPARVVVLGGGVAGLNAAQIALGMRADVTLLDIAIPRLRAIDEAYDGRLRTVTSTAYSVAEAVADADLVIGAVLVPGAKAPRLVTDEMVAGMKTGSVLVDIAIDQGGCFEGSRPTTHADPTFAVHDSLYYCVANMPGAVAATSTAALTNATLPYVVGLADQGWREALTADAALAAGLNTCAGEVTYPGVAQAFDLPLADTAEVLAR